MIRNQWVNLALITAVIHGPSWAQFTPPSASAPARPTQAKDSGVNTRLTMNPSVQTELRGAAKSPSANPMSKASKEFCEKWRRDKKAEHEACVNS